MATVSAKLEGVRELKRIMRKYPDRAKRQVGFALQKAAYEVRDKARTEAPVDTGNLVSSIQTDFSKLDELYAEVFSALEYARRQEYGFTGTDSLGRSYDQAGFHYFQKAINHKKKTFSKEIGQAVRRAVP